MNGNSRTAFRVVVCRDHDHAAGGVDLVGLSKTLALPLVGRAELTECDWVLCVNEGQLVICASQQDKYGGPVYATLGPVGGRHFATLYRHQPLAKAIGRSVTTVVDATAGLGQDSFLIAGYGPRVIAMERSPIVAALLNDGLRRGREQNAATARIVDRISLQQGDAQSLLPLLQPPPDVVYIDPMFPPKRRKSALAKKEIRTLRTLVGDDSDAHKLLQVACAVARRRVVVKRPDHAPPLAPNPTVSHKGKLVRYDVYVTKGIAKYHE
ncbi:MAG: class I SAM-dependent methyltransferase [Gammaproteobacteria bacterium]|nr:class I SAM-dependent methyltransferase [Gammaproteobacteria bacterium]